MCYRQRKTSSRFPSSGAGNGSTVSHDMIRFTPDDTNIVAGMSPLRLGEQSIHAGADYDSQVASLCRHRTRRVGDPSPWLDDPTGPYATYYCSCRREPRLRAAKTADDDDGDGPGRDVAPPDVAAGPVYGTSTAGVSRLCGYPRQHVVVCTAAGAEKIYQERFASSCKYSTFLGGDDAQSRAARNSVSITVDGSGLHTIDHPAAASAAATDDNVTSSAAGDLASSSPVNL